MLRNVFIICSDAFQVYSSRAGWETKRETIARNFGRACSALSQWRQQTQRNNNNRITNAKGCAIERRQSLLMHGRAFIDRYAGYKESLKMKFMRIIFPRNRVSHCARDSCPLLIVHPARLIDHSIIANTRTRDIHPPPVAFNIPAVFIY